MYVFSAVSVSLAFTLMMCQGPLLMGLWVLFIAFAMSVSLSAGVSTWYGLILFLIYVGGMLVMFAYFAAISPNQEVVVGPIMMTLIFMITAVACVEGLTDMAFPFSFCWGGQVSQVTSIYSSFNIPTLILLGGILFLALIVVVKIANWSKGSLRPWA